jgi:hypothetical protein
VKCRNVWWPQNTLVYLTSRSLNAPWTLRWSYWFLNVYFSAVLDSYAPSSLAVVSDTRHFPSKVQGQAANMWTTAMRLTYPHDQKADYWYAVNIPTRSEGWLLLYGKHTNTIRRLITDMRSTYPHDQMADYWSAVDIPTRSEGWLLICGQHTHTIRWLTTVLRSTYPHDQKADYWYAVNIPTRSEGWLLLCG